MSSEEFPTAEDEFLAALAADPARCWPEFLRRYSTTLRRLIRHHHRSLDAQMDAYVFVCQKLAAHDLIGIRRFVEQAPERRARFIVWLAAVVRNGCIDWLRREDGRRELPVSVAQLGEVEQSIFRHVFWAGDSYASTVELMAGEGHAGLSVGAIAEIVERIHAALPRTSRWSVLLEALRKRGSIPLDEDPVDDAPPGLTLASPAELQPDVQYELRSLYDRVRRAMEEFEVDDQLILLARFEQGLRFREIAELVGAISEQAACQRCRLAIERLRRELGVLTEVQLDGVAGDGELS